MPSCMDVARYFLALVDEEDGEGLSNLKLQKLLYYAQGYHLAMFDEELFPERMEAWALGPVVPAVYHEFKYWGSNPIRLDLDGFDPERVFEDETRELLDEVYRVYGQFSAWKLSQMTHRELPWRDTPPNERISHRALKEHFEGLLSRE